MLRPYALLLSSLSLILLASVMTPGETRASDRSQSASEPGLLAHRLPTVFEENVGQWPSHIRFQARSAAGALLAMPDGVGHLIFGDVIETPSPDTVPFESIVGLTDDIHAGDLSREFTLVVARLVGAREICKPSGRQPADYYVNYFIGSDPSQWHPHVPTFESLVYEGVYDGIDLRFYWKDGNPKYDFLVKPGAEPSQIRVRYDGAEHVYIDDQGSLVVETELGTVRERPPVAFEEGRDISIRIPVSFEMVAPDVIGFRTGPNRDRAATLIIDPEIWYSSFLGGSGADAAYDVVAYTDVANERACVAGYTWSPDFDTLGTNPPYQGSLAGTRDAFVTKLSLVPPGFALYSTYLGGGGEDWAHSIDVTETGDVWICGLTRSANFPTAGSERDNTLGGECDGFVVQLSSDGSTMMFGTYLGGSSYDACYGTAWSATGSKNYVTGMTYSTDFPTTQQALQNANGGYWDAFVTSFSSAGHMEYSAYLGGSFLDAGYDIASDLGFVAITGLTRSRDFPTDGEASQPPYQEDLDGIEDAFVSSFVLDGASPVTLISTYLGGGERDYGRSVAIRSDAAMLVTGRTWSSDFDVTDSVYCDTLSGACDVFVTALDYDTTLVFSTYLGGSEQDYGRGISYDSTGAVLVAGRTESEDFPAMNEYSLYQGAVDAFLTKLTSDGRALFYSTYLGGLAGDYGRAVSVSDFNNPVVAGITGSSDFPITSGAYDSTYGGAYDAFVTQFLDFDIPTPEAIIDSITPDSCGAGATVHFGGHGLFNGIPFAVDAGEWTSSLDGLLSSNLSFATPGLSEGDHQIRFRVRTPAGAWSEYARSLVIVTPAANTRPSAYIDSIKPNPADSIDVVLFDGHGDDSDLVDTIIAYEWQSDIDGALSDSASFAATNLSVGTHRIQFRVQDSRLAWSSWAEERLVIRVPGSEEWDLSWWHPADGDFTVHMHERYACTLTVTNPTEITQVFDHGMEFVTGVPSSWGDVPLNCPWEVDSGITCWINGGSYSPGALRLDTVFSEDTHVYAFGVSPHWNWIAPWSITRLLPIILSILSAGVAGETTTLVDGLDLAGFFMTVGSFETSAPKLVYSYQGMADMDGFGSVDTAQVTLDKILLYWSSYLYGLAASMYTSAGFTFLASGQPWVAAGLFVAEAILYAVSEVQYVMAVDPRDDWNIVSSPRDWDGPDPDEIPDSWAKDCALASIDVYRLGDACCSTYARFLGAQEAGEDNWATLQLATAYYYITQQDSLVQVMDSILAVYEDSIPATDVDSVRSLIDDGIPEEEKEYLQHVFDCTQATFDSLKAAYQDAGDDFIHSVDSLRRPLEYLDSCLSQTALALLDRIPQLGEVGQMDIVPDTLPQLLPLPMSIALEFPRHAVLTGYELLSAVLGTDSADYINPIPVDTDLDGIQEYLATFSITDTSYFDSTSWQLLMVAGELATAPDLQGKRDTLRYSASVTAVIDRGVAAAARATSEAMSMMIRWIRCLWVI